MGSFAASPVFVFSGGSTPWVTRVGFTGSATKRTLSLLWATSTRKLVEHKSMDLSAQARMLVDGVLPSNTGLGSTITTASIGKVVDDLASSEALADFELIWSACSLVEESSDHNNKLVCSPVSGSSPPSALQSESQMRTRSYLFQLINVIK